MESFLRQCEASRKAAVQRLEETLRGLRAARPSTSQIASRIARCEADLRALQANKQLIVSPLSFPPEVGAIGRLPRLSCHVDQIVSSEEMVVRCQFPVKIVTVRRFEPRGEKVFPIVTLRIRGMSTAKFDEGSDVELTQVFEITAARTADGGSGTTWVLKLFDMDAAEAYRRAHGPAVEN